MASLDTDWIEAVMRLNSRIVAAQVHLSAQAASIIELLETRNDITEAEGRLLFAQMHLRLLRETRNDMLSEVKAGDESQSEERGR